MTRLAGVLAAMLAWGFSTVVLAQYERDYKNGKRHGYGN